MCWGRLTAGVQTHSAVISTCERASQWHHALLHFEELDRTRSVLLAGFIHLSKFRWDGCEILNRYIILQLRPAKLLLTFADSTAILSWKDGRMWAWCHHLQCSSVILWKVRTVAFSSPFAAVDAAQTNLPERGHLWCGGGSLWESWWVEVCIEFHLFGSGSRSCGWYLGQLKNKKPI